MADQPNEYAAKGMCMQASPGPSAAERASKEWAHTKDHLSECTRNLGATQAAFAAAQNDHDRALARHAKAELREQIASAELSRVMHGTS